MTLETLAWQVLGQEYLDAVAAADPELSLLLEDAQALWAAYVNVQCQAEGSVHHDDVVMSRLVGAHCVMGFTADRALGLRGVLINVRGRERD